MRLKLKGNNCVDNYQVSDGGEHRRRTLNYHVKNKIEVDES